MISSEQRYSRPDVPRAERPIRLGTLLFTLVQPRAGHEAAYNRWYERDHFYSGCMIGEYTLAGGRFVATRDCKALRYGTGLPGRDDLSIGSYLALYWILDGHHQDWDGWAVKQVNRLHAEGRMFLERDHIHTGFYRFEREYNAPGSAMPIELALDRPYAGLAAFVVDLAPGSTAAEAAGFFADAGVPGDVALLGSPLPMDDTRPADVPASAGNHVVLLSFSPESPIDAWQERYAGLGERITAAGIGSVAFASPFLATVFGTDTYTDQL